MALISFLLKAEYATASVAVGIAMGFHVVFLTTSSHDSFSLNTSNIQAFHETKFAAPSYLFLVLNPTEVIFSKNKFQQNVLLSQRFF